MFGDDLEFQIHHELHLMKLGQIVDLREVAIERAKLVLPTPGGPAKHRIGPLKSC